MSTPLFRRKALHAALLAIPAFALSIAALAADVPQVKVTVNDKQCEPMQLTVPAGKTQFVVHNTSQKNVEWEILKGVMVVEERENIAPGFTQKMTATLEAGEYDMTCGPLSNPKGKLTVTAATNGATDGKTERAGSGWPDRRIQGLRHQRSRRAGETDQAVHRRGEGRQRGASAQAVRADPPAL